MMVIRISLYNSINKTIKNSGLDKFKISDYGKEIIRQVTLYIKNHQSDFDFEFTPDPFPPYNLEDMYNPCEKLRSHFLLVETFNQLGDLFGENIKCDYISPRYRPYYTINNFGNNNESITVNYSKYFNP